MSINNKPNIVFIGAGNLAANLAYAFFKAGCSILQVYSLSEKSSKQLAVSVESTFTTSLSNICKEADIYFICVPDKAIQSIADSLNISKGIVVHTSGSTEISTLNKFNKFGYGVFYPFQTFSKSRIIPFDTIPICINANNAKTFTKLNTLASLVSRKVVQMDSSTLTWLHLSGVIANNFTNHLLSVSHQMAKEKGFDFELLKPLVEETIQKAFSISPIKAQTGPAIRFDQATINLHIEKLKDYSPELVSIYKTLTLSIQSFIRKSL